MNGRVIEHDDFQLKAAAKERVREETTGHRFYQVSSLITAFLIRFHKPESLSNEPIFIRPSLYIMNQIR
ncbi:hypothetical protein ACEQPO_04900 [Bacillus sp. SL00103]